VMGGGGGEGELKLFGSSRSCDESMWRALAA
jgi:hypothetical protein